MKMRVIGIDPGQSAFHRLGMDQFGKVVARKRLLRSQMMVVTAKISHCLIGMDACFGSHFVGAELTARGHQVRLMQAQFVKPFLKSNKNDYLDAEAIAEAVQRPNMRFVPIKTDDQLDIQALYRIWDRLVSRRTSVINQLRAFLLESGITFRQGWTYLRKQIPELLEDAGQELSPRMRQLADRLWQEWKALEEQIRALSREIESVTGQDAA